MKSIEKIAISGTYRSGKTTTAVALSLLTGIPRTEARSLREIIRVTMPGRTIEDCSANELAELGLLRFRDRMINESKINGKFFSDGSCLHEWVYGQGRLTMGIAPEENFLKKFLVFARNMRSYRGYVSFMEAYGTVAKRHAKESYDIFIHLPIEFSGNKNEHRAVFEDFRVLTDQLLRDTLDEIQIPYYFVRGNIEERLEQILDLLSLKPRISIADAVLQAEERVRLGTLLGESYIHDDLQQKKA